MSWTFRVEFGRLKDAMVEMMGRAGLVEIALVSVGFLPRSLI